jgi:hypothetical protein
MVNQKGRKPTCVFMDPFSFRSRDLICAILFLLIFFFLAGYLTSMVKPICRYWDAATVRLSIAIFVYYVTKTDLEI